MTNKEMAQRIIDLSGGKENFENVVNCMTRVRVTYKNDELVKIDELKELDFVQGVVIKDNIQIIVGPGKSSKIRIELNELLGKSQSDVPSEGKKKKGLLKRLSNIFVPTLPAIIASGILTGINNILTRTAANKAVELAVQATENATPMQVVLDSWHVLEISNVMSIISSAAIPLLAIYVGMTAAREFETGEILGGVVGAITIASGVTAVGLTSGQGGLFGVILAVYLLAKIEKLLRKVIPDILDVVLTPLISLSVVAVALLTVIMPVAGYISDIVMNGLMTILEVSGIFGGFVLSAFFPLLISTGLHHGINPIHMEFINATGSTPLFTVQIMSNAGMVGAAVAVFFLSKNKKVKDVARGAIPAGFLAVGEPVIYGVNIPAGFAFITGSIGAGFGGALIRLLDVQSTAFGAAGMSALPLIADGKYLQYLLCYAVGASAAFGLTYIVGKARKYQ